MNTSFKDFLIVLEFTVAFLSMLSCSLFLMRYVLDVINKAKRKYQYKHRFDKPPLAKCYCKDCKYRVIEGICSKYCFLDIKEDGFCCDAAPNDSNPEE